jgi:hypothetical protein
VPLRTHHGHLAARAHDAAAGKKPLPPAGPQIIDAQVDGPRLGERGSLASFINVTLGPDLEMEYSLGYPLAAHSDVRSYTKSSRRKKTQGYQTSMNPAKEKQASRNKLPEVVIPKENAVFWMDGRGRWCNRHGPFEHKRIIDHFNRSIGRDADGYYVTQERSGIREKVYFNYVDTPLFVVQVTLKNPVQLALNTGATIPLDPRRLFTHADQLYQRSGPDIVKFNDRALMALARHLKDSPEGLSLCLEGQSCLIPERPCCT